MCLAQRKRRASDQGAGSESTDLGKMPPIIRMRDADQMDCLEGYRVSIPVKEPPAVGNS